MPEDEDIFEISDSDNAISTAASDQTTIFNLGELQKRLVQVRIPLVLNESNMETRVKEITHALLYFRSIGYIHIFSNVAFFDHWEKIYNEVYKKSPSDEKFVKYRDVLTRIQSDNNINLSSKKHSSAILTPKVHVKLDEKFPDHLSKITSELFKHRTKPTPESTGLLLEVKKYIEAYCIENSSGRAGTIPQGITSTIIINCSKSPNTGTTYFAAYNFSIGHKIKGSQSGWDISNEESVINGITTSYMHKGKLYEGFGFDKESPCLFERNHLFIFHNGVRKEYLEYITYLFRISCNYFIDTLGKSYSVQAKPPTPVPEKPVPKSPVTQKIYRQSGLKNRIRNFLFRN